MVEGESRNSVLWLEDDTASFEIAQSKLRAAGFDVDLVPDLNGFKGKLAERNYDIILIDIRGETFNGLNVLKSALIPAKGPIVCILSGFLGDREIQIVLEGLDRTVFVLDKSYPFDENLVEFGIEAQLKRIVEGKQVHTNRSYFAVAESDKFDVKGGVTTYERYIRLNPSEKLFVKDALLDLAEAELSKLAKQGYKWFLVCGPKGKVLKKSKTPLDMSSDNVSQISAAQGFPCVLTTRDVRNEEIRPSHCSKMYDWYFSVTISFSGNGDKPIDVHFDSGSQVSWFDLQFLKRNGIGLTGDLNWSAHLHTSSGHKRVWYYQETRQVAVHDQENLEKYDFTDVTIRGLNDWEDHSFSGASGSPLEELCSTCQPHLRCLARVGLLGQDFLRAPKPIRLLINGKTGRTSIITGDD